MTTTYMKEKKILPLLLSMAIPMMFSMLINSLYNIVDGIFVARMGEDAMMAISLVFPIQNLLHSIAVGFGVGTNAVIAIYLGSGRNDYASSAAAQGLLLNALHGLLFTIGGILSIRLFLGFFSENEQIIDYGVRYGVIVLGFAVIQTTGITCEKIFQSLGRMITAMISLATSCLVNIILDPIMIFGFGPIPAMGIEGAAWATGIGQISCLLIYVIAYRLKPLELKIHPSSFKLQKKISLQLYGIGIPATLNMALPSLLVSALNALLAAYSEMDVLILGIYYKLQTFLYLPANGVIQGMRPIMSYNYGAGEKVRVKKIYQNALSIILLILASGTILCLCMPSLLIGLFTENAVTITAGSHAIRIICIGFAISALSVTSEGALEAMGKGVHSLMISCLRYVILILPFAYILSHFTGAVGVWHAFWITECITAAIAYIIFYRQYKAMPVL